MIEKLLISGHDKRLKYCAECLDHRFDVTFENDAESGENQLYDGIVLPVNPVLEEHENAIGKVKEKGLVFAGRPPEDMKKAFPNLEIIDYTLREDFALLNAVPSAEGAVKIALEELNVTLSGLKILIVGGGRIGTVLVHILKGFGAEITLAVRSAEAAAKAVISGVKYCCMGEISGEYSLVFNTAPAMIFDEALIGKFSSETLFIDLASGKGGIDFQAAEKHGIKAIHALGIPAKHAPVTAGKIIADTILRIIAEKEAAENGQKI